MVIHALEMRTIIRQSAPFIKEGSVNIEVDPSGRVIPSRGIKRIGNVNVEHHATRRWIVLARQRLR